MFFQDLNFGLLTTLGAVSWIGLCVFNALAFSPRKYSNSFEGSILMPVSSQQPIGYHYRFVDWAVIALLVNLGFCLVYHLIKNGLQNVLTCLNQLGNTLSIKMTQIEEHSTSLELVATQNSINSQQLCTSIQSNQHEFVELMDKLKSIQSESKLKLNICSESNKTVSLTPLQQANIERSLFYLQQISDFFRVKFQKSVFSSSVDMLKVQKVLLNPSANTLARRKSLYSVRSEIILKRISRELMQPIRQQYNEIYMKNFELQQRARQLNDRRFKPIRKSRSQTTVVVSDDCDRHKTILAKKADQVLKIKLKQCATHVGRLGEVKSFTPKSNVTLKI